MELAGFELLRADLHEDESKSRARRHHAPRVFYQILDQYSSLLLPQFDELVALQTLPT